MYYGGAHDSVYFRTFAFFLDPISLIASLQNIFKYESRDAAFQAIQYTVREEIRRELSGLETEVSQDDFRDIDERITEWDCFNAFTFEEKGIEIAFGHGQLGGIGSGCDSPMFRTRK